MSTRPKDENVRKQEARFISRELGAMYNVVMDARLCADTPIGRRVQMGKIKMLSRRMVQLENAIRNGLGRRWK